MRVSVAMAVCNGEKFIREQLESILPQLGKDDEVVVSDDGPRDKTLDIVKSLKDERIKVVEGPKKGVKQNFANAIKECVGDYIFLADQDDIWLPNKVSVVLETFKKNKCVLVVHDAEVFDSETNKIIFPSFFAWRKSGKGVLKNIWKNTYIGCCMAFSSKIKKIILPIPDDINMHDQWIGILSEKYGRSVFIPDILIKYRRHSANQTELKHDSMMDMLKNRRTFCLRYLNRMGGRK